MTRKLTVNEVKMIKRRERMAIIEKTSCTMCTAKWLQSTIYLMNGFTHSCHHPSSHKIPLEELEGNPGALHNTKHKIIQRMAMLAGERPPECEYCWNIEDLEGDHVSDRVYKSTDVNWSMPYLHRTTQSDPNPTYLEVAFENTCNFKCAYCSPEISSKWMEEVKQLGPYPTSWATGNLDWLKQQDRMPIPNREPNPYIDAFWEWWPSLYKNGLHTFRITGGEPLLSKNTWKILEYVRDNPRADFTLAINSNFDVPEFVFDRFIKLYNEIYPNIRDFEVYTSLESTGPQAEYVRYGLDYERFKGNVEKFLEQTPITSKLSFMVTFNILSASTFHDFLTQLLIWRKKYNLRTINRLPMMISYVRWPPFMNIQLLPKNIKKQYALLWEAVIGGYLPNITDETGKFYLEEMDQVLRLCDFMLQEPTTIERDKKDFALFFDEYDKRRGTNFDEVFPNLIEFKRNCIE